MKAVHLLTVHTPFDQRIFYRECISLQKAGFEIILLARHTKKNIIRNGVRIISIGMPIKSMTRLRPISRIYNSFSALNQGLKIKADVYHIHDPELLIIVPILKLLGNALVIYDCHEDNVGFMLQKMYIPVFIRKVLSKSIGLLERFAALFLDAIVTADAGVEKKFKKMGAKTEVLHNFPRLDLFPPSNLSFEKKFDLVYHGSLPRYHMEVCFAVDDALIRRGRKVSWLFFGYNTDKSWVERIIANRLATDRFFMKNPVPHNKIADEISKARIGIIPLPDLPKFQFNIPTKLFEFMALGMPVVMSDLPPSRPFVKDGDCAVMVPPDDFDAYADAIIKLLDEPDLRIRMGRAGRLKVEEHYNWDNESKKLVNLYNSLNKTDHREKRT